MTRNLLRAANLSEPNNHQQTMRCNCHMIKVLRKRQLDVQLIWFKVAFTNKQLDQRMSIVTILVLV